MRAAAGAEAVITGGVAAQAGAQELAGHVGQTREDTREHRSAAVRTLIKLRAHKAELILLAVAAGCVISFASWLDGQLRPAVVAHERNELAAEELRDRFEPCLPNAGRSHTSWCGAITIPAPRPQPVVPIPLIAGAPAAFCTANGGLSC